MIAPASGDGDNTKLSGLTARLGYATSVGSQPRWNSLMVEYDQAPNPVGDYQSVVLADSPVGYWRLGETSGTNANDLGSGNHDGTYNGPILGFSRAVGDTDGGVHTDGVNDNVNMANSYPFTGLASHSVEAWIRPTAGSVWRGVVGKAGPTDGWGIYLMPDNTAGAERGGSSSWEGVQGTTVLQAGVWYHVVASYDGTTLRVYVNGAFEGSRVTSVSIAANSANLLIGRHEWSSDYYNGGVDEVAVYSTALSLARIQAHYNAGKP